MASRSSSFHRSFLILGALISAFAVVALYVFGAARAVADEVPCGSGAVIIVGGTNDPDADHVQKAADRYEDDGYVYRRAQYPTTLWPLGAVGYDDDVERGKAAAAAQIVQYQTDCRGSPIVVVGYSQGARVAGDVLSDIGTAAEIDGRRTITIEGDEYVIDPDRISGELYSDPRQDGDITGRGIELSMIGVLPGLTMTGPREGGFGDVPVTEICAERDLICDMPDPLHDPIGTLDALWGYVVKHGLYYPSRMGTDPAAWDVTSCAPASEGSSTTNCVVHLGSSLVYTLRPGLDLLGLDGSQLPDFLAGAPTLTWPTGVELSAIQPALRQVLTLFPPLPRLGYGGYLPDVLLVGSLLSDIVQLSPAAFTRDVTALADSIASIVMVPVNYVRYWGAHIVGPLPVFTWGQDVADLAGGLTPIAKNVAAWLLQVKAAATTSAAATESVMAVPGESTAGSGSSGSDGDSLSGATLRTLRSGAGDASGSDADDADSSAEPPAAPDSTEQTPGTDGADGSGGGVAGAGPGDDDPSDDLPADKQPVVEPSDDPPTDESATTDADAPSSSAPSSTSARTSESAEPGVGSE